MKWQDLTAPEFAQAVKDVGGVCILSAGCLEKHGNHLPLGTDFLTAFDLASRAGEREPALVFPPFYFTQIHEARCFPGTVALDPILTLELLLAVCDEISRNGCHKIIILNGHGGNRHLFGYLAQAMLSKRRDYSVYVPTLVSGEDRKKQWNAILTTDVNQHACECETSMSLALFPELVKMDRIDGWKTRPLDRLAHLPEGATPINWYADFPEHYAGDANPATAEKGHKLVQLIVDSLAQYIRAVKQDNAVAEMTKEFYDRCDQVGK